MINPALYYFASSALTITLNTPTGQFEQSETCSVSVAAGATIKVSNELKTKAGVTLNLGYNAQLEYRKFTFVGYNTIFGFEQTVPNKTYHFQNAKMFVYIRLDASNNGSTGELIFLPHEVDYDGRILDTDFNPQTYAGIITYEEKTDRFGDIYYRIANTNNEHASGLSFYYIHIGTIAQPAGLPPYRSWLTIINQGQLETSKGNKEDSEGIWNKMFRLSPSNIIEVLLPFDKISFFASGSAFIDRIITTVADSLDGFSTWAHSNGLATTESIASYMAANIKAFDLKYFRKDRPDSDPYLATFGEIRVQQGMDVPVPDHPDAAHGVSSGKLLVDNELRVSGNSYLGNSNGGGTTAEVFGTLKAETLAILRRLESKYFTGTGPFDQGWMMTDDDANHNSYLVVDNLFVRMKAIFTELEIRKISYAGGNIVFSHAGSKIERVKPLTSTITATYNESQQKITLSGQGISLVDGDLQLNAGTLSGKTITLESTETTYAYRCYIKKDDGTTSTENWWRVNDQARCQTFNIQEGTSYNVHNSFYWRRVLNTGTETLHKIDSQGQDTGETEDFDFVDLSNIDCISGSTEPEAGDAIVQMGNRTDATRQGFISLEVADDDGDAPAFKVYKNVNSYSLNGKRRICISPKNTELIVNKLTIETGYDVQRVPMQRGDWGEIEDHKCYYYDLVQWQGSSWLCIYPEEGIGGVMYTTDEPSTSSAYWNIYASKGETGNSFNIKGTYDTVAEFEAAGIIGSAGEAYVVADDLYIWDAVNNRWNDVGRFKGDDGNGISNVVVSYGISPNSTTPPEQWYNNYADAATRIQKGQWLWTKTVVSYTDAPSTTSYTMSYQAKDGAFKSTVFLRNNKNLASYPAPQGGNYNSPFPVNYTVDGVVLTWQDGIPQGEQMIWVTSCIFYADGTSSGWSTPAYMSDTSTFDVEFSANTNCPADPSDDVNQRDAQGWRDPERNPQFDFSTVIWRAERQKKNGVWGSWIKEKIKGESITKSGETHSYQVSDDGTTTPTGTWYDSKLAAIRAYNDAHSITPRDQWAAQTFMWTKTVISWSDTTSTTLYSADRNSADGEAGMQISVGTQSMQYAQTDSGTQTPTQWGNYPSTLIEGKWLWTKITTPYVYTNGSSAGQTVTYTVSYIAVNGGNPIFADIDNEMDSVACDSSGKTTAAFSSVVGVNVWVGSTKKSITNITPTAPSGITVTSDLSTPTSAKVTISVNAGTTLAEVNRITLTVTAQDVSQNQTLHYVLNGVRAGTNGKDAVIYSLLPSVNQIVKKKSGGYDPSTAVTCDVTKMVGGTASTPDPREYVLKMSINGQSITDYASIVPSNTLFGLKYYLYNYNETKLLDTETIAFVEDGDNGRGISTVSEHYKASTSPDSETTPTSDANEWGTNPIPQDYGRNGKKYLWNYEKITYSDGNVTRTDAHVIASDGKLIDSITDYYKISSKDGIHESETRQDSGWSTNIQNPVAGNPYLWNYEEITYLDNKGGNPTPTYIEPHIIDRYVTDGKDSASLICTPSTVFIPVDTNSKATEDFEQTVTISMKVKGNALNLKNVTIGEDGTPKYVTGNNSLVIMPWSTASYASKVLTLPSGVASLSGTNLTFSSSDYILATTSFTVKVSKGQSIASKTITVSATGVNSSQEEYEAYDDVSIAMNVQGLDAVNVSLTPASLLLNQNLETKNIEYPDKMFSVGAVQGETDISGFITSIAVTEMKNCLNAEVTGNVVNFLVGTYTETVGTSQKTYYYDNGYIELDVTIGGNVFHVRGVFYCNLLGTWKETVEDDTKTAVAEMKYWTYDEEGNPVEQVNIGTYIQSSSQNTAELTEAVSDEHGTLIKSAEIKETVDKISLKVGESSGANLISDPVFKGKPFTGTATDDGITVTIVNDQASVGSSVVYETPWKEYDGLLVRLGVTANTATTIKNAKATPNQGRIALEAGGKYTLSVWVLSTGMDKLDGTNHTVARIQMYTAATSGSTNNANTFYITTETKVGTAGDFDQYAVSFEVSNTHTYFSWSPYFTVKAGQKDFYVAYAGVKLEKGKRATIMDVATVGLLDTGIDIQKKKITLTADNLECKNNSNVTTMSLDANGNLSILGVLINLAMTITDSNCANYGSGTLSGGWWLDPTKCGPIVNFNTSEAGDIKVNLPCAADVGGHTEVYGHLSLSELRQCIGKAFYLLGTNGNASRQVALYCGAADDGLMLFRRKIFNNGATEDMSTLVNSSSGSVTQYPYEEKVERWGVWKGNSGFCFVRIELKMGRYQSHECLYWEVEESGAMLT